MSDQADPELEKHKRRVQRAWQEQSGLKAIFEDVYTYCLPFRRGNISKQTADRVFDMTSMLGSMYSAQNLKNDLSPPGQDRIALEPGPLAKKQVRGREMQTYERALRGIADDVNPHFNAGDFDTALEEACVDLLIGRAGIMPIRGRAGGNPVRFVCIPTERLAIQSDVFGQLTLISWRQEAKAEQIADAFPQGDFDDDFMKTIKDNPDSDQILFQDFERLPSGRWRMRVYCERSKRFILQQLYRSQPVAVPYYFQTPGDVLGGGPLTYALPSIKTLNKAQELALRAGAMQLLGIWGYRAGGTFNPDTVRLGAGEFWPMLSTGGVLGPDVQRLDPATGRLDIARMLIDGMRDDIKQALFDNRLPRQQGTPVSAQEIVARLRENAKANIGAFGRIWRGLMPVLTPRITEILYEAGLVEFPLSANELLAEIRPLSPMQQAIDASRLQSTINYFDMVQAVAGPESVDEHIKVDTVLKETRRVLAIPDGWAPSADERNQLRQAKAQQQAAITAAQFALEAQKVAPEQPAGVMI